MAENNSGHQEPAASSGTSPASKPELIVSQSAYGERTLPFRCPQSMAIVFYLRMCQGEKKGDLGCKITQSAYPYHPVTGELPALRSPESREWLPAPDALRYLSRLEEHLDRKFSEETQTDIEAFREYIITKLLPVYNYTLWGDRKNTLRTQRVWCSSAPIVLRLSGYLSWKESNRIMGLLEESNCNTRERALKKADQCLKTLTTKFGSNLAKNEDPSLFNALSSADATLAGMLYAIFEIDVSRNIFRKFIREKHPSFEAYYKHMTLAYLDKDHKFPDKSLDMKAAQSKKVLQVERWLKEKTGYGVHMPVPSFETAQLASFTIMTAACLHLLIKFARKY